MGNVHVPLLQIRPRMEPVAGVVLTNVFKKITRPGDNIGTEIWVDFLASVERVQDLSVEEVDQIIAAAVEIAAGLDWIGGGCEDVVLGSAPRAVLDSQACCVRI